MKPNHISEDDVITTEGKPFLHHLAESGIVRPLLMAAFQSQSELIWQRNVATELGITLHISKLHNWFDITDKLAITHCTSQGEGASRSSESIGVDKCQAKGLRRTVSPKGSFTTAGLLSKRSRL